MTEVQSNGLKECKEIVETSVDVSTVINGTVEALLAKYLIDFVIEEDTVLGYINDLDTFKEILEKMKNLGFPFSVRDSDARQKQREKIKKVSTNGKEVKGEDGESELFCHLTVFYQLKAMPIKFFGLPFTIDKTTHYQCAYGCKYYKSRAGSTEMMKCTSSSELVKQVKKKKRVGSKKMGCLAKMTIKHITVYPEYKLDVESDWRKKKKLIENLRKDFSDSGKVVKQFQRFYLSVSVQSSHNHPPIMMKPKVKVQKAKSHRLVLKSNRLKRALNKEAGPSDSPAAEDGEWGYAEVASSSLGGDQEQEKSFALRDDTFFHTLVKFPNAPSAAFEHVDYKPNEIEIEIKPYEPAENTSTIEVYEYQPTIQDLQTLFKEKLKNLYTLCTNCSNGSLILKLAGELEQVELQLSNDVNYSMFRENA